MPSDSRSGIRPQSDRADFLDGLLLVAFLIALPFYVLPSGLPQPADIALLLLLGRLALRRERLASFPRPAIESGRALGLFVLYAWALSLAWTLRLGEPLMLAYPLFYTYNLAVFGGALLLFIRPGGGFLRLAMHATAVSLLLQVLLSPLSIDAIAIRQSLYLNNPNQLGYFALLAATLFVLGDRRRPVHTLYLIGVIAAASYLTALSLSKSALLALAMLILFTSLARPWILAAAAVAAALLWTLGPSDSLPTLILERILGMGGELDNSLAGRGYDRIGLHPGQLFLGAGEGAFWRFDSFLRGEIHSSFGTLLFSYGLAGLLLFLHFLYRLMRGASTGVWLLLMPVAFYGLTHQGLRFRLLWVTLALALAVRIPHEESR